MTLLCHKRHKTGESLDTTAGSGRAFAAILTPIEPTPNGIAVISGVRFSFAPRKSNRLRANLRRGIGFKEAPELFSRPFWLDQRSDVAEQFRAIVWVGDWQYSVIFEVREDDEGELLHLVT